MPANLEVRRIDRTNQFALSNIYPNETGANAVDTITISIDGKYINEERIKSRRRLPGGDIEMITEQLGKDGNDNKEATFRHTYIFGKTMFKKRKEVQFEGETGWIMRHEYSYSKRPGH
jgi:hypothetical protein